MDGASLAAVIAAAGSSKRIGLGIKKEYCPLPGAASSVEEGGPTVLGAAFSAFASDSRFSKIVIVHPPNSETGEDAARRAIGEKLLEEAAGRFLFVPGGDSRQISVYRALAILAVYHCDFVFIHDGARPWLSKTLLDRVVEAVLSYEAAIPVLPLSETPKIVENGIVSEHLKRERVFSAQTPQGFSFKKILEAHKKASQKSIESGIVWTDDAEIYGEFAGQVRIVKGEADNKKITFLDDLC